MLDPLDKRSRIHQDKQHMDQSGKYHQTREILHKKELPTADHLELPTGDQKVRR